MIITTEVLDRPRITFTNTSDVYDVNLKTPLMKAISPPTVHETSKKRKKSIGFLKALTPPPTNETSKKRKKSTGFTKRFSPPPANKVTKKRRKSMATTEIITYPQLPAREQSHIQVATASIFLRSPTDNLNNFANLNCGPFIITAMFSSSNLRVDPKIRNIAKKSNNILFEKNKMNANSQNEELMNKNNKFKNDYSETNNPKRACLQVKVSPHNSKAKENSSLVGSNENKDDDSRVRKLSGNKFLHWMGSRRNSSNGSEVSESVVSKNQTVLGNNANSQNTKLGPKPTPNKLPTKNDGKLLKKADPFSENIKGNKLGSDVLEISNTFGNPNGTKKSSVLTGNSSNFKNAENSKVLPSTSNMAEHKFTPLNNREVINRLKRELQSKGNINTTNSTTVAFNNIKISTTNNPNNKTTIKNTTNKTMIKATTSGYKNLTKNVMNSKVHSELNPCTSSTQPKKNTGTTATSAINNKANKPNISNKICTPNINTISIANSKNLNVVDNSAKRPSISFLQSNTSFMKQIRSRNNSLTSGTLRTRNNSLSSVLNFRPGNRNDIIEASNFFNAGVSPKPNRPNWTRNGSFSSATAPKKANKRMGKTTTTTEKRTYQKDGKWFEETVETTVVESKDGTRTSTKTTTSQLPGPPNTKAGGQKQRSRSTSSSSSSRSPSPSRSTAATPSHQKTKEPSTGGLLSRLMRKTSKGSSSSSSDDEAKISLDDFDKKFSKDVQVSVNEKRSVHGVRHLKLSDKLTQHAMAWARHLASQDKMQHKQDKELGENIYKLTANLPVEKTVASAEQIVTQWYSECSKHKFHQEPKGAKLETGHFTQLVWKDSTEMGVALALSNSKRNIYVVAFFSPKGNWMGEFSTHVPPVGGFSKIGGLKDKIHGLTVGSSSSDDESDFAEAVLKSHNAFRNKHGVPPLKLSGKLNDYADNWAKTISRKDRMEHRPNNEYGENLYAKWHSNPNHTLSGHEAVESWYSEIKDYSFGKEPRSLAAGHFTQVVWKDSTELGVGLARNKTSGKLYVVCNYDPAGNMMGQFAHKVPRPSK